MRIIITFILIFISNILYAADYYIKTTGNNTFDGTNWSLAWKTIGYAASNVRAGDVVIVSNGIYNEQVTIQSNGTSGSNIIFQALNQGQAIVNGAGNNYCFDLNWKSYIQIKGFVIKNSVINGIAIYSSNNYIVKNTIYSNSSYGIYIHGNNNFILTNYIYGNLKHGIGIWSATNNLIKFNQIHNNESYGLYLTGSSAYNYITRNIIKSNVSCGIVLDGDMVDNNYILTNYIGNIQTNSGIYIQDGDNNIIRSNQIYNNQGNGISLLGNAVNNYIIKNTIYSNEYYGIIINSTNAVNNYILTNNIWGANQNTGIKIYRADNNRIRLNKIHHNESFGIHFSGSTIGNHIIKNEVYSNNLYGIAIISNQANNNYILTNKIWGPNHEAGIIIKDGNTNKIYRNLIYNNKQYGINIIGSASGIEIINNTIFHSISSNGVLWDDSSGGVMYNNIILSNGNGAGDYGIENTGLGLVYVAYNDIYGNKGGHTNGSLSLGSGNIFQDPLIDTVSTFIITSGDSPAIDSGTNIPGITDGCFGLAPDMGWKEAFPDNTSPAVFPDKEAGSYIGDLDLKLTAYKNASKQEIDSSALIMVTILRNNTAYQSFTGNGVIDMILPIGARYTLKFYATDAMNNTSAVKEAEYIILKESQEEIAVYPTIVNPNERDKITFIYNERKNNIDVKICTLRGDVVKTISGVDFTRGLYEYSTKDLQSLPTSQYILKIGSKETIFVIIK